MPYIHRQLCTPVVSGAIKTVPGGELVLDQSWVENHRDRIPPTEDRSLSFLRKLILVDDQESAGIGESRGWLWAASGCYRDGEFGEFWAYVQDQGWAKVSVFHSGWHLQSVSPSARMYVEARDRIVGQGRRGFVAMWFDPCMDKVYTEGFKPAIEAAGYDPYRVDQYHFLGKIDD